MSRIPSRSALRSLEARIVASTGEDRSLDLLISKTLGMHDKAHAVPDYTSSVDTCLALIGEILPGWHWHIGRGANGIFPYASLRRENGPDDEGDLCIVGDAPTVSLALLHAVVRAMMASQDQQIASKSLIKRSERFS